MAAGKTLNSQANGVLGKSATSLDKRNFEEADVDAIVFPWMKAYKIWWGISVVGAILTVFFTPYQIAFKNEAGAGPLLFNDGAAIIDFLCGYSG